MKKLLLALLPLLLLTGCMRPTQLDERLLVQAVGVDYREETDRYTLTLQTFHPEGEASGFDPTTVPGRIYTAEGETPDAALRAIGRQTGKEVFLGSNRLLVVGESAESRLPQILGYFSSGHEVRPKTPLLLSRETAAELLSVQSEEGELLSATAVQQIFTRAGEEGSAPPSTLLSAVSALQDGEEATAIAYAGTRSAGEETAVELLGAAVVDRQGVRLHLTPEEYRGAAWLQGTLSEAALLLQGTDGSRYTLLARPEMRLLTAELQSGRPVLQLRLYLHCTLIEALCPDGGEATPQELSTLRALALAEVEGEIRTAFEKLLKENRADIFHAARYLEKYCPRYYRAHAVDPAALYAPLGLQLQLQVDISALPLGGGAAQKD